MNKAVILTGLRANNELTLGNYFGAMLPMIEMAKNRSDDFQINMFIPDLHSFTTPIDHSKLLSSIISTAKYFIAAGLPMDNSDIRMYRQSYIPAHSELTWILDCFTGMGELSRMTQYKDKSSVDSDDRVSVGLFNYPVLMAADILLYSALYVPVGDDQTQHLEFTRNIAERFNATFGHTFEVPLPVAKQHEFFGKEAGLRIKDLVDPTKKMSKSNSSPRGTIFLSDSPSSAAKKVMSATTDNIGVINNDPKEQPGISNLIEILALLQNKPIKDIANNYTGSTEYRQFKKRVADAVSEFLSDFHRSLDEVNELEVLNFLEKSEASAKIIADSKLLEVQKSIGLRPKGL